MNQSNKEMFIQSVGFIYDHLDESITLDDIAIASSTSVSTLKRVFEDVSGQSPGSFIRRLRMEYAFRSLQSKNQSVIETALAVGFEDHSAFSRSFKSLFGYAPTEARKKLNIVAELESITLDEPDFIEIKDIVIQSVTCKGLYFECAPRAWQELGHRLTDNERGEAFTGVFIGIGHDNPHEGEVEENQVRFTAGIGLAERDLGIEKTTIKGGRYARFRYEGKIMNLGLAYHHIYGKWLQDAHAQVDHGKPAFLMLDRFPNSDGDAKITIHVPLEE